MNIEDLKQEIPFKWRVQSVNEWAASCVAYVDARDVQDLLDNVLGANNWQCKYEEHKGNLFCSIGVRLWLESHDGFSLEPNDWIWKSDCGTESNVEKQKGEASDAFKRAAVMWGIGRFLYSKKIIKLKTVKDDRGKFHPAENGKKIYADRVMSLCNELSEGKPVKVKPIEKKTLTIEDFNKCLKSTNVKQLQTVLDKYKLDDEQKHTITVLIENINKTL